MAKKKGKEKGKGKGKGKKEKQEKKNKRSSKSNCGNSVKDCYFYQVDAELVISFNRCFTGSFIEIPNVKMFPVERSVLEASIDQNNKNPKLMVTKH